MRKEVVYIDKYIDEVISEWEQCREDERSAQNQQLQVIATAGAILGGVYTAASIMEDKAELTMRILFYVSGITLLVAISYISSLGISNVLRYHYMRDLEDRLYKMIPRQSEEKLFTHWMSFSSIITTRNPLHLRTSLYTIFHYSCYTVATLCALVFCVMMILFQYKFIQNYSVLDKIVLYSVLCYIIFTLVIFCWMTIKAKKMYTLSAQKATEKRNLRLLLSAPLTNRSKNTKTAAWKTYIYFLYPKKKDFQKSLLIIVGFAIGTWMNARNIDISQLLLNGFFCWLLLDFFIYQARYLWNDIRGISEDLVAGKSGRLPIKELGVKKAVKLSSAIIFLRLFLALVFIQYLSTEMQGVFLVNFCVIVIIAVIYEIAREKGWNIAVFLLVSLGYPIRAFAGFWVAYPMFWTDSRFWQGHKILFFVFIVVFLIYMCVGEISAILPWTHEVIIQMKNNKTSLKSHYRYLFSIIEDRYQTSLPLREKGKLNDIWNIFYIIGVLLLVTLEFMLGYSNVQLISMVMLVVFSILLCTAAYRKIVLYTILSAITIFIKNVLMFQWDILHIFVMVHQFLFIILYFILRYYFDPEYDFFDFFKKISNKIGNYLLFLFVGKKTYNYFLGQKQKR